MNTTECTLYPLLYSFMYSSTKTEASKSALTYIWKEKHTVYTVKVIHLLKKPNYSEISSIKNILHIVILVTSIT